MSSDPTEAMRLGTMSGRMSALSMRRKSLPTYEMYTTSRSVHVPAIEGDKQIKL